MDVGTAVAVIHGERSRAEPAHANALGAVISGRLIVAATIVAIAICYIATLKPGHVFVNDDFAAYVMHAQNLIEGHRYADIRYIPNPEAMWLSPATGYPPVYPMILAPVYRLFGMNLRAFKIATVLCFLGFLVVYVRMTRYEIGWLSSAILAALISFNPVFWGQRDFILSEFPYLLFSFATLLAIEHVYAGLERNRLAIAKVLLVSLLLYCSYGTRSIGIALVFALIAVDLAKFRRPSLFLLCVLSLTGVLIGAQALLLTSPKGYVSAFHFSTHTFTANVAYYAKTLSYFWANGFSKGAQVAFALVFTAMAAFGFAKSLWRERGAKEFYLLGYVAVLLAWNSEIGLRGLLPIVPLYFLYGVREWSGFFDAARLPVRIIAMGALVGFATVSYAGEIRHESTLPAAPNVGDAGAAEMFAFVREHTSPRDVIVFPKPRTLALFTGRRVAALSPEQSPEQSLEFLRAIHATVLVEPEWNATRFDDQLKAAGMREVFQVRGYRVYRLNSTSDSAGNEALDLASRNSF